MRILFFSFIVWLSTLAIAAADNAFFKFCRMPVTRTIRNKKYRGAYVKHEEFLKYVKCKEHNHRVKVDQLNHQLLNGENCPDTSDNDYPEYNATNDSVNCTLTECRTGFHYDSDHCQQNICRCQNGKAVTGTDCQNHDQEKCDPLKCNQGFHYEANHCVKNVCKCQNGRGAAGSDCRVHDQEKCDALKCNQGFHYDANHCVENVCSCRHGKAVTGTDCDTHNQEKCDALKCNPGFHYEANHCMKNICKCQHGKGMTGTDCDTHNDYKCHALKCNQGFHYDANGECVRYVLYTHRTNIPGYREMTAAELSKRLLDIGRSYELGKGFNAYREEIDVTACHYCSADNKIWYLNGKTILSGNYGDNSYSCEDNKTGICSPLHGKNNCSKTEDEFLHIEFGSDDDCELWRTYALFISDTEPILS